MQKQEFKLDQHIMVDKALIKRIVSLAGIMPGETVLEIGAGFGNLTKELAGKSKHIIAVEIDRRFKPQLRKLGVKVITGNILKEIKHLKYSRIVSNLPYAICEPLFQRLPFCSFKFAVLTMPRGFAYRLLGNEKLGLLAQEFFEVRILLDVPKRAFKPEPRTSSVVISLEPRKKKTLLSGVLLQPKFKVKNAIMRALFSGRKMTKKQARKRLKSLKLNNKLLEKRVMDIGLEDFKTLKKAL